MHCVKIFCNSLSALLCLCISCRWMVLQPEQLLINSSMNCGSGWVRSVGRRPLCMLCVASMHVRIYISFSHYHSFIYFMCAHAL